MSDLIDRQALKNKICDRCEGKDEWCNGPCFEIMIIDSIPAIAISPWHRVEEELPQSGEMVMIYDGSIGFGRHEKGAWEWVDTFESGPAKVTHWMPIPEPPKEEA